MVIHNSLETVEKDTFLDNHTGIDHLEKLIKQDGIVSYNPDCVRKKSNWSKKANKYFEKAGNLRRIQKLQQWPLRDVMMAK